MVLLKVRKNEKLTTLGGRLTSFIAALMSRMVCCPEHRLLNEGVGA